MPIFNMFKEMKDKKQEVKDWWNIFLNLLKIKNKFKCLMYVSNDRWDGAKIRTRELADCSDEIT